MQAFPVDKRHVKKYAFHLRQGAHPGHTDIQSRVRQWIPVLTRSRPGAAPFFSSLNQSRFRSKVWPSLPSVTAAEIRRAKWQRKKTILLFILRSKTAGSSIVLILEDFKAARLQVEFQGRDGSDLW